MSCCEGGATREGKIDRGKPVRTFKYGGPAVKGNAFALFDNGRAYRVEGRRRTWFLYNDTLDTEIHVSYAFAPENKTSKPKRSRSTVAVTADAWEHYSIIVYPLQTVAFVKFGVPKPFAYRATNAAYPLTAGYIERVNRESREKEEEERRVAKVAGTAHNDEELVYKCRKSGIQYVDLHFKPCQASLGHLRDSEKMMSADKITWRRPQSIVPEETRARIKLFRHGVRPGDIGQGQLGDCWLMSSIAVVASSTTMIKDMFRHPVSKSKQRKEQAAGAYRVYLNREGWWQSVIVDSYLPTYNGFVCFGRNATDPYELWVSLLEKAYAKVHGSYAAIVGGSVLNALSDLTGFPVFSLAGLWTKAVTEEEATSLLFKNMLRYRKAGYLIGVSTPGPGSSGSGVGVGLNNASLEEHYRKVGLSPDHAYSILKVRQFSFPRLKLLQIRNPWGTGTEWTGAWSKSSSKWKKHPLVRWSCKPSKAQDGTFWMEWADVVRYFDTGYVCMVKKSWYGYRFPGIFMGFCPSIVLKLEPKKKQSIFFTISQRGHHLLDLNDPYHPKPCYEGLAITVSCYNVGRNTQELCAVSTENPMEHSPDVITLTAARDVAMEMELDPKSGPYYVVPRIAAAREGRPVAFVLGVLTPVKSTQKGLRVSFVRLPADCDVFHNSPFFCVPRPDQPLVTQFQYKKRAGVPRLMEGITAFGAKKVKEHYPFPY